VGGWQVAGLCRYALGVQMTMDNEPCGASSAVCQEVVVVQRQSSRFSTFTSTL
jgi:hypothetical protein